MQAGRPLVLTEAVTLTKGEADGGSLKALIRDSAGKAVVGASFTATSESGTAYTAVSDGQGTISLTGLPAGTYRTQVYRSFYQVPAAGSLTVATGETADAGTVTLTSTVMHFGKISGQLIDEAGQPVDGAIVQLDPPVTEQVFTDAQGRFTLDRVMPGEYTMRASAGGFEVNERTILVDNRPGYVAELGGGFVLRQPFDPSKPKKADRPAVSLLPPNAKLVKQGNDLVIQWEPVGLPQGLSRVAYEIEAEVGPNIFLPLMTTHGHSVTLPGFANVATTFQVRVRPDTTPAAYRVAQLSPDLYPIMELFQKQAQAMRDTARQERTLQLQAQTTALQNAAQQMKDAAALRMQAAVIQGTMQIVGGAVQMGASQGSISAGLKAQQLTTQTLQSQAKLKTLNGEMAVIQSGIGKVSGEQQKQAELDKYEAKSKEAEAERKALLEEAMRATEAARTNELMQQMMDVIRDVRDKLASIQQSQMETMRGIARNI
ncbi:hypothetical protein D3C72_861070 [compost metagenome]